MADSSYTIERKGAREPPNSRSYKKFVIIAVSVGILVFVIILTGVLVGLRPLNPNNVMHFSYDHDEDNKEDMMSDPNKNMVMYHVTRKEYQAWLINDFNRDIQVIKIQTDLQAKCFVTGLNRNMAKEPAKMKPPSGDEMSKDTYMQNMTNMTYRTAEKPVSDLTFMCETAKNSCDGMSTYWLFPTCENSDSVTRRPKRFWGAFIQIAIGLAQLGVSIYDSTR